MVPRGRPRRLCDMLKHEETSIPKCLHASRLYISAFSATLRKAECSVLLLVKGSGFHAPYCCSKQFCVRRSSSETSAMHAQRMTSGRSAKRSPRCTSCTSRPPRARARITRGTRLQCSKAGWPRPRPSSRWPTAACPPHPTASWCALLLTLFSYCRAAICWSCWA